jgi:hypothetical protein
LSDLAQAIQVGIAGSATIEGTAPVGGIPPVSAAGGGTAAIMPQLTAGPFIPATVLAAWAIVVLVLLVFHVKQGGK